MQHTHTYKQRGHQQPLETIGHYIFTSLLGGIKYPIAVAVGGIFYNIGKLYMCICICICIFICMYVCVYVCMYMFLQSKSLPTVLFFCFHELHNWSNAFHLPLYSSIGKCMQKTGQALIEIKLLKIWIQYVHICYLCYVM